MYIRNRERKLLAACITVCTVLTSFMSPAAAEDFSTSEETPTARIEKTVYIGNDGLYEDYDATTPLNDVYDQAVTYNSDKKLLTLNNVYITGKNDGTAISFIQNNEKSLPSDASVNIELKGNCKLEAEESLEDHAIQCMGKTITFSGSGSVELTGKAGALYPAGTEDAGLKSANIFATETITTSYKTDLPVYASKDITGTNAVKMDNINDAASPEYKYIKIGGAQDEKKDDNGSSGGISYNIIVNKVLEGDFGGHDVSVNYMTNVKYDGRVKVQAPGCTKKDIAETNSLDPCIIIQLLVDGKEFPAKDITATFYHNKDVYCKVKGNTVSGCASIRLKLKNTSEYGSGFTKGFKAYFKNKDTQDNIKFSIIPDVVDESIDYSKLKKSIKIENGKVIKTGNPFKVYKYDKIGKTRKKNLRFDSKNQGLYNKKEYTIKVINDHRITIVGEGDFTGEYTLDV